MRQDQRDAARAASPFVHEVDQRAVDVGAEVVEFVEPALLRTPVELAGPVVEQPFQIRQVSALTPCLARCGVRPPGGADPRSQIRQQVLIDRDRHRLDVHRGPRTHRRQRKPRMPPNADLLERSRPAEERGDPGLEMGDLDAVLAQLREAGTARTAPPHAGSSAPASTVAPAARRSSWRVSRMTTARMMSNMPAATAAADVPKLLVQTPPTVAPTTKPFRKPDASRVLGKIDHWRAAAKATGTVTTSAGALSGKQATAARMTISARSTNRSGRRTPSRTCERPNVSAETTPTTKAAIGIRRKRAACQCREAVSTPNSTTFPVCAFANTAWPTNVYASRKPPTNVSRAPTSKVSFRVRIPVILIEFREASPGSTPHHQEGVSALD